MPDSSAPRLGSGARSTISVSARLIAPPCPSAKRATQATAAPGATSRPTSAAVSRRVTAAATTPATGNAHNASAASQPSQRSSGTVRPAASAAPAVSVATYAPVTAPTRRAKRPLTTLGTMTFAAATPAPARRVPAKSANVEPAARQSTPTRIGSSASRSTRSAPMRRASAGATGASAPKQRTGAAVSSPASVAESPRSCRSSSRIGGTLATAIRRLRPVRTIPIASKGPPARAAGLDVLEPDVVLGERGRRPLRRADVGELCELELDVEVVATLEPVQHRGHEPGEMLRPPDTPQRLGGVALEQRAVATAVPGGNRLGQDPHVRNGDVEPLRVGRRHDVGGIAGEKEPARLHRLDDETPHPGHALLEDLALVERPALEPEPALELFPDPLVRPFLEVLVRPALEVETGHCRRAHAVQREAALVVRVDQCLVRRARGREDAEPAERVLARERAQHSGRDAVAADAVEAVAAGDQVAAQLDVLTVVAEADQRRVGVEVVHAHVVDLEEQRPAGRQTRGDQVFHHLLLAVDGDPAAAGQ